ncbi:MAG TPA: hypothetical protein VNA13_03490 [Xanthomonadales bacterium]|nr:hypothetical protein [Xanthomonadales bacterium]
MAKFIKLKSDKYRKSRGGYSRLLEISCAKCGSRLLFYQKDGPGILKRVYLDRIYDIEVKDTPKLFCSNCKVNIGTLIIYEKENRPAFKLLFGSVTKKIVKANKIKV